MRLCQWDWKIRKTQHEPRVAKTPEEQKVGKSTATTQIRLLFPLDRFTAARHQPDHVWPSPWWPFIAQPLTPSEHWKSWYEPGNKAIFSTSEYSKFRHRNDNWSFCDRELRLGQRMTPQPYLLTLFLTLSRSIDKVLGSELMILFEQIYCISTDTFNTTEVKMQGDSSYKAVAPHL